MSNNVCNTSDYLFTVILQQNQKPVCIHHEPYESNIFLFYTLWARLLSELFIYKSMWFIICSNCMLRQNGSAVLLELYLFTLYFQNMSTACVNHLPWHDPRITWFIFLFTFILSTIHFHTFQKSAHTIIILSEIQPINHFFFSWQ